MAGGSLRVLQLLPSKTGRHDIVKILLKVALSTINQSINQSIEIQILITPLASSNYS
jgi:hypothetical protein